MTCPDCGHEHCAGWGGICIGCPCPARPVRRHPARVQANADDYPDAAELHAREVDALVQRWRTER